ncbi:MAG: SufD family Fe-S cluster assembly protein, partial [Candidatus Chisholmbacteria bacterium]|nr:SufD family Fe-S cluster assembly protein [Candidatus Chisholmbacteria bacterium]
MQIAKQQFKIKKDQKKIIRVDKPGKYVVELVGEGAEAQIVGAFRGRGKDEIEIEIEVNHKAPNTMANTHIRGVVD